MAKLKSCINGSGPRFHVNSGSGRVGSLYLWVGLGRIKKTLQDFVLDSRPVDGRGANVQLT